MFNLWEDTANQWFPVRFVDDTDLFTGVTGIQASSMTLARSKAGGSGFVAITAGNFRVHQMGSGSYWVRVNAASEFDTVGPMVFRCMASAGFNAYSTPVAVNVQGLIDGVSWSDALAEMMAKLCNNSDKAGNIYTYANRADSATLLTHTHTRTTRTRS